jgi:hypothetical protein
MTTTNLRRRIAMSNQRLLEAVLAVSTVLATAVPASAQIGVTLPTVVATFEFSVPFALAVSHPCQAGVVALSGNITLKVTTVKSSDFKFQVTVSSTGEGRDAGSNGVPLANGSLPYAYSGAIAADAQFPGGTPAFFAHPLSIGGAMIRSDTDAFMLTTDLELEYVNGVPAKPKLAAVDVSCR